MPKTSRQLVLEAKRLERLQRERRVKKRALRELEKEIKHQKRIVKALESAHLDPDDQLPAHWKGKVS